MIKKLTTTSLLTGLLTLSGYNISCAETPKLVVGIVVDQLRTDYLEQLRPYFGDNGFNRLITQGVYFPDLDFKNTVSDAPAGAAVIYTGAWPVTNGVSEATVADHTHRRSTPTLSAGTSIRPEYSPENLRVSTLTDEFVVTNGNLAKAYSLTADPQVAVVTAGHAGTAAIWFDETSGKWNSPAYYSGIPSILANKNRTSPLPARINSSVWKPLNGASIYSGINIGNQGDFSYTFSGSGQDAYRKFKSSALFNGEVTDAALDLLKSLKPSGSLSQPGMLSLEYSLAPIDFDFDGDNRPEIIDAYIRLDREVGKLLDAIDREYGIGNATVFLSSSGYAKEPEIPEGNARIPSGEITLRQAESLLNAYLSATHGNGDYVELIRQGKLYLDHKEAEKRGIDIRKLRQEAKDFMLRMSGIADAVTIDEVWNSEGTLAKSLALATDPKNTPDLFLFFAPGWTVTDDNNYPATSYKVRLASPSTPAFILDSTLEPLTYGETIDATAFAPTVAATINIRAPNAAAAKPIPLKRK